MKRIQSNTVELTLQDIVEKFKIKNASNLKLTVTGTGPNGDLESGFEVPAATTRIVLSFDVVKAEKKKGGGRPRKVKPGVGDTASNGAAAPASA